MILTCLFYSILCILPFQSETIYSEYQPSETTLDCDYNAEQAISKNALDVSNIPLELLVDANAVVRYEHKICNILSEKRLQIVVEKAVTVLSEKGISSGDISIYYNGEADEIKDLKVEILDAKGNRITKIKKKEINDVSQYDGFSIANDARRKIYRHVSNSFPYTVLFSYKKESPNTLIIPSWFPIWQTNVSIEVSTYKINSNVRQLTITNKPYNIEQYGISVDNKKNIFAAKHIKAFKSEKKTPSIYSFLPFVRVSPSSFHYFDFDGSYSDWKSYGKWMYDNMLTGRGGLPPELIAEIEQKLNPELSGEEKARIIYDHVTNSTRYVSVQLGIGGFMPFKCTDVYNLKYGDCKALSYYTQNLLQHFGVEAIYTEIKSDREYNYDYDTELPGVDQGNHIILCLPNEGDTIWLECTSKDIPFGYTHAGINNRKALLIKPEGGEIITTATYSPEENLSVRNITLHLREDDGLIIDFINEHRNLKHESMRPFLDVQKSKQDKYIKEYYYDQLASLSIETYQVEMDDKNVILHEKGTFITTNHIEKAGNYRMIPLNVFTFSIPDKLETDRSFPIYVKDYRADSINITMEIPEDMTYVSGKTPTKSFENEYGKMNSNLIYDAEENRVVADIYFQHNAGAFLPESVDSYNEFVHNLRELVDQKIIIKPTE
ncbi:MAG: hypothetical protein ACJA1A_002775 [Saprospiraceae bacterium]|jgi:hypothetical protein